MDCCWVSMAPTVASHPRYIIIERLSTDQFQEEEYWQIRIGLCLDGAWERLCNSWIWARHFSGGSTLIFSLLL